MNFFTVKTSWSNTEFIPVKLCIASAYVMVGTYFHQFFKDYFFELLILFAISLIWLLVLWISKMNAVNWGRRSGKKRY